MNIIHNEDCISGLKQLPDNSVHCCVTSPPYYGLRDYGTAGQIGLEETPEIYVAKMTEVFNQVHRVLMPEGTLWLNLGDSYWGGKGMSGTQSPEAAEKRNHFGKAITKKHQQLGGPGAVRVTDKKHPHIKAKDLIGIPWMVAFALRSRGWYLRQDIIWSKPNPMPESVTDRCTKAHEYIFLLSKSGKYYYDAESIKTEMLESSMQRNQTGWSGNENRGFPNGKQNNLSKYLGSNKVKDQSLANKRSVWHVPTMPYSEAHFATFPEKLIVDCIKAGCPENGIVLDPFMGAGTTGLVAKKLNRHYIGYELNPDYVKIAEKRIATQIGLFA